MDDIWRTYTMKNLEKKLREYRRDKIQKNEYQKSRSTQKEQK